MHSHGRPLAPKLQMPPLARCGGGQLVSELVDVVGEAVEGVGGFVDMRAVVGALAGLDHHDVLVEGLTVLAAELDADGSGDVGAAAAAVHAGAAVLGPVLLQAGAAGVGELHWLAGLLGSAALLSFLHRKNRMEIELNHAFAPRRNPASVSVLLSPRR